MATNTTTATMWQSKMIHYSYLKPLDQDNSIFADQYKHAILACSSEQEQEHIFSVYQRERLKTMEIPPNVAEFHSDFLKFIEIHSDSWKCKKSL